MAVDLVPQPISGARATAALIANEWRLRRRDLSPLLVFTAMPLALSFFMIPTYRVVTPEESGAEQAVPGMAVMFSMFLVAHMGLAFFQDYGWNTWSRYLGTALPMWAILVGKAAIPYLMIVVQLAALLACGQLLFDLRITGSLFALLMVVVMFSMCLVALAFLGVVLCRTVLQLTTLTNVLSLVFAGFSGALVPVRLLPHWVQETAPFVPSYWAVRGMRAVIVDGAGLAGTLPALLMLVGFTLGLLAVSIALFRPETIKVSW